MPAGQNNLEVSYAGLSYLLPDQIRFRYRLEGFDSNWIDAGRRRQAFYTNLPPGDYTFRVAACSYDGPCNEQGAAIQFTLAPFLYQRVWFWPLMVLLAGALGWGAYQLHIRRLRERYDLILSERSRIARELHDDFGQVLTAIGTMVGRVSRQLPDGAPLRADLREVAVVAQDALDNMRRLSQSLHPSILEELGLGSTVDWYMSTVSRQLGLQAHYTRAADLPEVDDDVSIQVYRILQEALSNVARHSGVHEVWVRLGVEEGELQLDVEDHGSGPPTADNGRRGFGLVTMTERAALAGGRVDVVRPAEGGTLVRLVVPLATPVVSS